MAPKHKRPAALEISLTYPTTNDSKHPKADISGRFVSLRISDRASGMIIVEVDLSAVEWTQILSGCYSWVTAGASVGTRLDRVGKRRVTSQVHLGRLSVDSDEDWQAQVDAAAEPYRADWEVVEGRKHNTGTTLHLARWIDAPETEA